MNIVGIESGAASSSSSANGSQGFLPAAALPAIAAMTEVGMPSIEPRAYAESRGARECTTITPF